jgi:hypothetical protein
MLLVSLVNGIIFMGELEECRVSFRSLCVSCI